MNGKEAAFNCTVCQKPLGRREILRFSLVHFKQCEACGSWNYFPRLSEQEQIALHDNAEYFEHPYFVARRNMKGAIDRRCREVFKKVDKVVNVESLRGMRVLDIGCDTGGFLLSAARQFGIQPVGIDIARQAVQIAVSRGIEAYHTTLERAPEHLKDFCMIMAIDLLEHVSFPESFLWQIASRLQSGGLFYFETPNIFSCVYQMGRILCNLTNGRPRWIFERLFMREHCHYFTCQSLNLLAQRCGFEVVCLHTRILPFQDISAAFSIRLGVRLLQLPDILTRNKLLFWGIFRKT